MSYALRLAAELFDDLQAHAARYRPAESAALILIGRARDSERRTETLLGRRALLLEPEAYDVQARDRLVIRPRFINSILALCEANNLGAMFCHSHPGDIPFSGSDYEGEERLYGVFSRFLPNLPFASLLLCPSMTMARIWTQHGPKMIDRLRLIGPTLQDISLGEPTRAPSHSIVHDRQERLYGRVAQTCVANSRVAIVGAGGTGSPTAEQVVRVGVRDVVLIDPDTVDASSISRGYGMFPDQAIPPRTWRRRLLRRSTGPVPKVEAVAAHLRRISPEARITAVTGDVVEERSARLLLDRDFVFICIDEHWGRAVINQLCYQYLIPSVNTGVRLDVRDAKLIGAAGSIQMLRPGAACLWCSNNLDSEQIRAESVSMAERARLAAEKYIVGVGAPAPMVVSLTTTVSGLAVTAFLNHMTGFLDLEPPLTRQNYYIQEGIVGRGVTSVREGCICKQVAGYGDLKGLPTVARRSR